MVGPVGKAAAARKLASAAAYGGGGLSVVGAGVYAVLRAEASLARRAIGNADLEPPDATGWYGRRRPGPAIKVALLGDSSAAGYGVERVEDTPGAVLGSGLAERAHRRIYLREFAKVGAQSSELDIQVTRALQIEPDVAVILVGANDVTHTVLPSQSVRFLGEAVRRLREAGIEVVVGTCPDLGTVRPIAQPLKQVARVWSRRLAAAQTITVVEAGGRSVALAEVLGPDFDQSPTVFFGPDRFHPSIEGYASLAGVLLPSVLAAVGLIPDDEARPEPYRGEGVFDVSAAAVEAVKVAGTELEGTEIGGSRRGVRGRWVELRRRRRQPQGKAEAPASEESEADASPLVE